MSSRAVVTCEIALEFLQRKKKLVTCECAHVTREWSTLPRLLPFLDERAAGRDPAGPELVNSCRSSRKTAVAVGSGARPARACARGGQRGRLAHVRDHLAASCGGEARPGPAGPTGHGSPCLVRVARLFAVTLQRLQGRSARIF